MDTSQHISVSRCWIVWLKISEFIILWNFLSLTFLPIKILLLHYSNVCIQLAKLVTYVYYNCKNDFSVSFSWIFQIQFRFVSLSSRYIRHWFFSLRIFWDQLRFLISSSCISIYVLLCLTCLWFALFFITWISFQPSGHFDTWLVSNHVLSIWLKRPQDHNIKQVLVNCTQWH